MTKSDDKSFVLRLHDYGFFRLNELHSVVCGVDFRSSILLLKCEASENQNRNKDVIIEKRKSMINRANATLQRDPKGKKFIQQKVLCNYRRWA